MPIRIGGSPRTAIRTGEPPGLGEQVFGGALVGASKDPLIGFVMRRIADALPGMDREVFNQMERELGSSTVVDASKFVGQFGPLLLGGFGIAKAGLAGGTALARGVAPQLAAGGGRLAGPAARVVRGAEGAIVGGTPGLERAAQIGGTAAGFGAFGGAEEAAAGGSARDIARGVAIGAALSGAVEVGFLGLAKGLRPRSSVFGVDVDVARSVPGSADARAQLLSVEVGARERAKDLGDKIKESIKITDQVDDLTNQLDTLGPGGVLGIEAVLPTRPVRQAALPVPRGTLRQRLLGADAATQKLIQKRRTEISAAAAARRTRTFLEDPSTYTREIPIGQETIGAHLESLALRYLKTPEAAQGQLGPTMNKFMSQMKDAQIKILLRENVNMKSIATVKRTAQSLLGTKNFDAKFMVEVGKYEHGGVAAFVGTPLEPIFRDIDRMIQASFGKLVRLGGDRNLSPDELRKLGVRQFFPHFLGPVTDKVLQREFTDAAVNLLRTRTPTMSIEAARLEARQAVSGVFDARNGVRQFGSIDHQRLIPGTIAEKIEAGMPLEKDPFLGLLNYMNMVSRRVETGRIAGINGELKESIKQAAKTEGAHPNMVDTLVDIFTSAKLEPQFMKEYSRRITNLQIAGKLPLSVIPNTSQTVNTALMFGIRNTLVNTLRGVFASKVTKDEIRAGLALSDEIFQVMRRQALGQIGRGITDKFADGVLKWTGFSAVEKFNRLVAGYTAFFYAKDTAAKVLTGRLRGNAYSIARRKMSKLGINLDEVRRTGQLTEAQQIRSAFRGMQETQFVPDATRRPSYWNSPMGRIIFQFKTFAMSQGRFLRDQVINESAQGNHVPLLMMLGIYPIAGELVANTVAAAKGKVRDEDGIVRILDNMGQLGMGGIWQNALIGAQFGKGLESILGPTVSDISDVGSAVATRNPEILKRQFERQPIIQAVTLALGFGAAGAGGALWTFREAQQYLDLMGTGGEGAVVPTLEELARSQRRGR